MDFKKEITLESKQSETDIKQKLSAITYTKEYKNDILGLKNFYNLITNEYSRHFKFEGNINDSNFKILPLFNYGFNQLLRPKIIGFIAKKDNRTLVNLKFSLPDGFKILFIIVVLLNLIIMLMLSNQESYSWVNHLFFVLITYLIIHIYFDFKVRRCKEILNEILN